MKLVLSQAAQLGIKFFNRKTVMLLLFEALRDLCKDTIMRIEWEEKSPATAGIEPTTSRIWLSRHVLYRCAATAAPNLVQDGSFENRGVLPGHPLSDSSSWRAHLRPIGAEVHLRAGSPTTAARLEEKKKKSNNNNTDPEIIRCSGNADGPEVAAAAARWLHWSRMKNVFG